MPFEIQTQLTFSAAHLLEGHEGHCKFIHGHNYKVVVVLTGNTLDKVGRLEDFSIIKGILKEVVKELDHTLILNTGCSVEPEGDMDHIITMDVNPTAENLAKYIYNKINAAYNSKSVKLKKVTIWETDDSCASYWR